MRIRRSSENIAQDFVNIVKEYLELISCGKYLMIFIETIPLDDCGA